MTQMMTIERLTRTEVLGSGTESVATRRCHLDAQVSPESVRAVEEAWQLKSTMEWTRDDRGPVRAFRWQMWDLYGAGNPPLRVEHKRNAEPGRYPA